MKNQSNPRERTACLKCKLPVVLINAEYRNARGEKRKRIEALHHKSMTKEQSKLRVNVSAYTPNYVRELLRKLRQTSSFWTAIESLSRTIVVSSV
jgi:hypothetical protein